MQVRNSVTEGKGWPSGAILRDLSPHVGTHRQDVQQRETHIATEICIDST